MINLEPIPKKIQERLEEKRRILSRQKPNIIGELTSAGDSSKLTYEKFNSRTPFLRMTSGQINPVILMGGKVNEDGAIPGGYDEIYGQRTYNEGGRKRKLDHQPNWSLPKLQHQHQSCRILYEKSKTAYETNYLL